MTDPLTYTYYIVFSGLCSLIINPTPDGEKGDNGAFVACAQTHGHRTMLTYALPVSQGEDSTPQITYRTESVDVSGLTLLLKSETGTASETLLSEKQACDALSVLNLYGKCNVEERPTELRHEQPYYYKKYTSQSRAYFAKRGDTIIELGSHSNVGTIKYYQLPSPIPIKNTEPASGLAFPVHIYTRFGIKVEGPLRVIDGRSGTRIAEVDTSKVREACAASPSEGPNGACQLRELHVANGPHFYDMVPLHKPDVHFRSLFSSFAVPPTTKETDFRVPIAGQPKAGGAPRCFGMLMAHE